MHRITQMGRPDAGWPTSMFPTVQELTRAAPPSLAFDTLSGPS